MMTKKERRKQLKEIALLGGLARKKQIGIEGYSKMGKKGGKTRAKQMWGGDKSPVLAPK